jgi:hypothetical protein
MCGGDPPAACSFYRGQEVLERIIAEQPEVFFLAMVKLAQGIELGAFDRSHSREGIAAPREGSRPSRRGRCPRGICASLLSPHRIEGDSV